MNGMKTCLLCVMLSWPFHASWAQPVELSDDPSRADLARYAMSKDALRAFPKKFEFPRHAVAGKLFGIDVSHHQGKVDWSKVIGQGPRYAYVKATQGERHYDREFSNNWQALGTAGAATKRLRRGAYHFMSALADPAKQADNYIKTVGPLQPSDLPPCLDVEWDFPFRDGKLVEEDQWAKLTSNEIVERVKVWLETVEKATGQKPIIYTNASWWKERVGADRRLAGYKLWISDFTSNSLNLEKPRMPQHHQWVFWQLTDQGKIASAGLVNGLDVNVFVGGSKHFADLFGHDTPRQQSTAARAGAK